MTEPVEIPTQPVDLRAARLRLGLSARAVAEKINADSADPAFEITEDVILWAERTKRRPSLANAVAIANYYGLDVIVQWPLEATEPEAAAA